MHPLVHWLRRFSRPARPVRAVSPPPSLEALEDRLLPTAYTVTTAQDLLNDTTAGEVTLRDVLTAIRTQAPSGNAPAGTSSNTVSFAIGTPGSVQTIAVGSGNVAAALPAVTHRMFLDGWTQGGAGYAGPPLIVLNGAGAGANGTGLELDAGSSGSTVRGLVIQQFGNDGIDLIGSSGDLIAGNYIGTNFAGTGQLGNARRGVLIGHGATANTVGGTTATAANLISANGNNGVEVADSGTSANLVQGNLIGTDITGAVSLGNANGVMITSNSTDNTVGGQAVGARNVISGNSFEGVGITGRAMRNVVAGNYVGVDSTGEHPLGNAVFGVALASSYFNTIGGTTATARNVLSASDGSGLWVEDSTDNLVEGNFIGTDATGLNALGNRIGIHLEKTGNNNTIGGTTAGARNVVSGNILSGIEIDDFGNVVQGNYIGTDVTGGRGLANQGPGVDLDFGATIGGTAAGAGNLISGNLGDGILIHPGSAQSLVQGNRIGTDATGNLGLGNAGSGLRVFGAFSTVIGGTAPGARNLISANGGAGVDIQGSLGTKVVGNAIGTDVSGTAGLGNIGAGVLLEGRATSNTVGGTGRGSGNVIAFNAGGVVVKDAMSTGDSVLGNRIFGNHGPGLDLGGDGPTPNGASPRAFANDGQNTPLITALTARTISGTLSSVPRTRFRLEFFATAGGGPAAQGQIALGSFNVNTGAAGAVSFTAPAAVPIGWVVTATATNLVTGDTSEFSPGRLRFLVSTNPVILPGAAAESITLSARLFLGTVPINSGKVVFTIAGLPGQATGSVNGQGVATVTFTIPAFLRPGQYAISAVFLGNSEVEGGIGDGLLTILAPPRANGRRSGP